MSPRLIGMLGVPCVASAGAKNCDALRRRNPTDPLLGRDRRGEGGVHRSECAARAVNSPPNTV